MQINPTQLCQVCSGRNTEFWTVLNLIADDATWNDVVNNYNSLEDQIDNGLIYGIDIAPTRPRPTNRP